MQKKRFPDSVYNPVTYVGAAIAVISFGLIVFMFLLELFGEEHKPYVGIIAFVILPAILIIGLILIAVGMWRERNRIKRGITRNKKFPVIDLNDPKYRLTVSIFSISTILLLLFSAFGSFKAYEYTDSDEFCGTVCHEVMEPEYTAYLDSPHSRVGCVQCHIGSGTDWFVKSKLSGAYQVYSVIFNKYAKPIETPVKELRPAKGTCEQCHSPEHFFNEKKVTYDYYLSDEENTHSSLTMLLKIGGGNSEFGAATGIHWHMNQSMEIYYIHSDERRLEIPWVKMIDSSGRETIFRDKEKTFNVSDFPSENKRLMDCIDCHNRPSHIFHQPDKMVNLYLSQNTIDPSLPYIKSVAVESLERRYTTKLTALDSINFLVRDFYKVNYPEIFADQKNKIENAILQIQKIYKRNYFPYMNANWKAFPNNISHVYTPGCFRCHDGNHVSDDGKVISNDCKSCHEIISQTYNDGTSQISLEGLDFVHPVDFGASIEEETCTDCHWE